MSLIATDNEPFESTNTAGYVGSVPRSFHRACRWVQLPYLLLLRYFGIFF
nr:MAG TPA: hypothetical protein [Caudoviricetes sp.]DAW36976.1 MAG TPA: hypothetical protein [Caudoviricetes sp.]DAX56969.1 MAG TPA: hypothetical protein [Caudoviricetes sp.]DAZ14759.1 MAG TPA: hypothetical protein [Caudoviricetes sp.]